jgi:lipoprotein-anchoring transpeptidase ErfK/SrfK
MKTQFVLAVVFLGSGGFFSSRPVTNPVDHPSFVNSTKKSGPEGAIYIIVDKSDYELSVFDEQGWYATYPVVFGNNSLADKKMQGDRNTPEGTFRIISKRIHDKWSRFIALDYPTRESWEKFNQRKQRGEIPPTAKIGGGIGIHGTWPHEDFQIDRYMNWTLGCISMKNTDVEELYGFIGSGTKVIIRK